MDAAGELSRGESSKQPGIGGDSSEDIKGLRVLVAEDNPLAIIGLRLLTVNLGHQVVAEATTGHEAIQQAALYQPDLILMDVKCRV